jgi:hypothetical protein
MIDASSLSIITSLKIDSEDRVRNAQLFIRFFSTFYSNLEIVIIEQGSTSILEERCALPRSVLVRNIRDNGPHYKTRNLNLATKLASRNNILMCDADVIFQPEVVTEALSAMDAGAQFVSPYNGIMVQIPAALAKTDLDFSELLAKLPLYQRDQSPPVADAEGFYTLYGSAGYESAGGALFYERRAFFDCGSWNENIVSYGFEDTEIIYRIKTLNYSFERLTQRNLYHFEHKRLTDSYYNNFVHANEAEYERVVSMDAPTLREYADNGFKRLCFTHEAELSIINECDQFVMKLSNSARRSLADTAIVLVVRLQRLAVAKGLHTLLRFFQEQFDHYIIYIAEVDSVALKKISNAKNVIYDQISSGSKSLDAIASEVGMKIDRPNIDVYIWDETFHASEIIDKYQTPIGL